MLALFSSSPSLLVPSTALRTRAVQMADIGETGVAFENVAREWRCKYTAGASGGPGDSASLKACQSLLEEYLPKIKALPKASVTRQVCGGCLDFKVSISQPLDEHGAMSKPRPMWPASMPKRLIGRGWPKLATAWSPTQRQKRPPERQLAAARASLFSTIRHGAWSEADYNPLEAEFLKKLKAIEGVSQVRRGFCGSGELDVDVRCRCDVRDGRW